MSAVQPNSPKGDTQHLFPSPTYSDSSLSSSFSSQLCTPDSVMPTVGERLGNRKDGQYASVTAANAAFLSATEREDDGDVFAHSVSHFEPSFSQEAHSLAAALDFATMSAEMEKALNHPSFSLLAKRATSSHDTGHPVMLHARMDSNSGRRHSIQPLMPSSSESGSSLAEYASIEDVGARSMSFSVEPSSSFNFNNTNVFQPQPQQHQQQPQHQAGVHRPTDNGMDGSAEYLMSPPRLTVSISSGNTTTPIPSAEFPDDAKRRRTSQVDATPERSAPHPTHTQMLTQQTPPNMHTFQQPHPQYSIGSSIGMGVGMETPSTTAGTDSVQSSASSCRVMRRLSLTAADRALHLANLTANLSMPYSAQNGSNAHFARFEPPKSAPPRAAADAMQRAQQQYRQQQPHLRHDPSSSSANNAKAATPSKASKSDKTVNGNAAAGSLSNASNGKNQDVWPDDVEVAFWEALRLIPKLGRRKVLVHGKPCGRNELIADYIERKTNKIRTRKQVSSHIQVLKNIRKGDPEFQQLIAEPTTEEDFYIPAGGMMYAQTLAGYGYGGLGGAYPLLSVDNGGLLSPYTPGLVGGQGLASPLTPGPPPMSATSSITSGLNDLHLPQPTSSKDTSGKTPCPILPASFSMWVHCSSGDEKHVYTSLDRNSMSVFANNQASLPQMALDSVRVGHFRFPRLAEMYHRMPCQFLHVHVPLSVPRHDIMMPRYDHFSTQLSLTSAQDLRLTSVTTVYSHGKRVLSLVEPLDPPRKISGRNGVESGPTSNSKNGAPQDADVSMPSDRVDSALNSDGKHDAPAGDVSQRRESNASSISLSPVSGTSSGPASPRTPVDVTNSTNNSLRHRWCHQAPFATDFWADFLSRNHPVNVYGGRDGLQSFGKEPSERAALGMAVSGVTIIQELVVANEGAKSANVTSADGEASLPAAPVLLNDSGSGLSPGSKVGDVVLVIAWDLECVEALGASPGKPTVSLLTVGNTASPMGRAAALPSPLHQSAHGMHLTNSPMGLVPGLSPMSAYSFAPQHVAQTQQLQHLQQQQQQQQQQYQQQQQMTMQNPPALVQTFPSPQPLLNPRPDPTSQEGGLRPPTLLRKRGLSTSKPNLMVSIPPAPSYLNPQKDINSAMLSPHPQLTPSTSPTPVAWGLMQQRAVHTPITPFPQLGTNPLEPPPLNSGDDARMQKERLERHWASQGDPMGGAFPSPLDTSFGHDTASGLLVSAASMSSAAAAVHAHTESALGLIVSSPNGSGNLLSPASFELGGKMGGASGLDSGNNSFESMLNTNELGNDASTQEYLNGLLASIGVEGQDYTNAGS